MQLIQEKETCPVCRSMINVMDMFGSTALYNDLPIGTYPQLCKYS